MKRINIIFIVIVLLISTNITKAQEKNNFKLSGELLTDQQFSVEAPNDWVWNKNRLTLNFNKKITDNIDIKIDRRRITWGTSDKLNSMDNLNLYDLDDILDSGSHRGSDGVSFDYYFNSEFSLQSAYVPFFQPVTILVGFFTKELTLAMKLTQGMTLIRFSDQNIVREYNLESTTARLKLWLDFSLSFATSIGAYNQELIQISHYC